MSARRIFLAATGQNRGKTTTSLGLAAAIAARGHRLGFLKPVGQRYVMVGEGRADEDAVLMKAVFDLPDPLSRMSPVTVPRHFTTDFLMGRITDDLGDRVHAGRPRAGVPTRTSCWSRAPATPAWGRCSASPTPAWRRFSRRR